MLRNAGPWKVAVVLVCLGVLCVVFIRQQVGKQPVRGYGEWVSDLKHEDPFRRASAAQWLGQHGDEHAVELVTAALQDKDDGVVLAAATALITRGRPQQAVEPLIKILEHSDSSVKRLAASVALGKTRDKRAVEPLAATAKGKADVRLVRIPCLHALADVGSVEAIDALIQVLKQDITWEDNIDEGMVRSSCVDVLKSVTKTDIGNDPEKWSQWWEKNRARYQNADVRQ